MILSHGVIVGFIYPPGSLLALGAGLAKCGYMRKQDLSDGWRLVGRADNSTPELVAFGNVTTDRFDFTAAVIGDPTTVFPTPQLHRSMCERIIDVFERPLAAAAGLERGRTEHLPTEDEDNDPFALIFPRYKILEVVFSSRTLVSV